jgi:GNAT superfamily N-acetyltransferase
MKLETKNILSDAQKVIITGLWNTEYPKQLNFNGVTGFEEFLNRISNPLHFLLLNEDGELKGWLMTFTRQDERWFSVIVDGKEKQKGFGTRLLEELKKSEDEISGWAIEHDNYLKNDGENYRSPIGFYQKNGFAILSEMRLEKEDYYAVKIKWTKE